MMKDFDQIKEELIDAGPEVINEVLEGADIAPVLTLKTDYSVTFQDPAKPPATAFKRFQCLKGDTFELIGARKTDKNPLILLFKAGASVTEALSKHAKGPGLRMKWEIAEFTMKLLENQERLTGREVLTDTFHLYTSWREDSRPGNIDRGLLWGSW